MAIFLALIKEDVIRNIAEGIRSKLIEIFKPSVWAISRLLKRSGRFIDEHRTSPSKMGIKQGVWYAIRGYLYVLLVGPVLLILLIVVTLPVHILKLVSLVFAGHNTTIRVFMILGIATTFAGLLMELFFYW